MSDSDRLFFILIVAGISVAAITLIVLRVALENFAGRLGQRLRYGKVWPGTLDRRARYPENWDEIADRIRSRDGNRCMNCGRNDIELQVHHIVPLSREGTNNDGNLVTLCRNCHKKIHRHMR